MSYFLFVAAIILSVLPMLSQAVPLEIGWGKPNDGLVIGIASLKNHWMTAEYITFQVYLKNVSGYPLWVLGNSYEFGITETKPRYCSISIDSLNTELFDNSYPIPYFPSGQPAEKDFILLHPGEVKLLATAGYAGPAYYMSDAEIQLRHKGNHTLTATYTSMHIGNAYGINQWEGKVISNSIPISVSDGLNVQILGLRKYYDKDEEPHVSIRVINNGEERIQLPVLRLQQTVRLSLWSVGPQNEWTWISESIPTFKLIPETADSSLSLDKGKYAEVVIPPSMFDLIMSSPGKYRLQVDFVSVDNDPTLYKETWKGSISIPGVEFEIR